MLVDFDMLPLRSLDGGDPRALDVKVAGPAGLLVAKLHKIEERNGTPRAVDKDALDVLRLLRGVSTEDLTARMRRVLADRSSEEPGRRGMTLLGSLFGRGGDGAEMAARAAAGAMDADEVKVSCEVLAGDLAGAIGWREG